MSRILLRVSYDGTKYSGWQVQPNAVTIEGELNKALEDLLGEEIQVIGASRTDAGVHSLGNVCVFDTESPIPAEKMSYALNTRLPEDIRARFYINGDPHDMYIGEVVEVLSDTYKDRRGSNKYKTGHGTGDSSSRWTVCMTNKGVYTAELYFMGGGGANQSLYEINKEVFDQAGTFEDDDYKTEKLIKEKGRLLYEAADERQTQPWQRVVDEDYDKLCSWADIMGHKK